jgi:hypothetical protein
MKFSKKKKRKKEVNGIKHVLPTLENWEGSSSFKKFPKSYKYKIIIFNFLTLHFYNLLSYIYIYIYMYICDKYKR